VGPVQDEQATPMTLVLVRHGESTWNELRVVQGQTDGATLTDLGRAQALDAARSLDGYSFDALFSSDLARATETAAVFAEVLGLPCTATEALRERCFGVREGRSITELTPRVTGISDGVVVDATARPQGGESLDDLHRRAGAFVEWLRDEGRPHRVLLVTHGGTIRAIRAYCAGEKMNGLEWDVVANASVWTVSVAGR
jgi:broad specificity phosphatase PhoE